MAAHMLLKGRTVVTRVDGAQYVQEHPTVAKYCDPPYWVKGDVLFRQRMTLADHLRLAQSLRSAANWVLSCDRSPVIEALYNWATCHSLSAHYCVRGKKREWASGEELVIVPPGTGQSQ